MIQPNGNIKFFSSQAAVTNSDTQLYPVVWDHNDKLPPFQLFKDYDGIKPTTFKLLSCTGDSDDSIDLIASIGQVDLYSIESKTGQFDALVYKSDEVLASSVTVDNGFWQIHFSNGTYNYYSLWISFES